MLRLLLAAPFLLLLILFTLSNRQPVTFTLWPTDFAVELPLSLAVLAAMGLAFLAGAVLLWFGTLAARHRARRAEAVARRLEEEVAALKAELTSRDHGNSPPLIP